MIKNTKLKTMMDDYSSSHRNHENILIHLFCVPLILFSILGMLFAIGDKWYNLSVLGIVFMLLYYNYLDKSLVGPMATILMFCYMAIFGVYSVFCGGAFYLMLSIFILSSLGQFYGHYLEGKNPAFYKNLFFLLIGPIWVFYKIKLIKIENR